MTRTLSSSILAVLLSAAPLQGGVYKCIDADGGTVYRDTSCPASGRALHVSSSASPEVRDGLRDGETQGLKRIEARKKERLEARDRRWRHELEATEKAQRKQEQLCAKARRDLARYPTTTTAAAHQAKRKIRTLCD